MCKTYKLPISAACDIYIFFLKKKKSGRHTTKTMSQLSGLNISVGENYMCSSKMQRHNTMQQSLLLHEENFRDEFSHDLIIFMGSRLHPHFK